MKRAKLRLFKYILVFISILFLIAVSGTALFVYFFPKDKLLSIIVSNIEKSLNRKVKIQSINYSLGGVSLRGVKLLDGKTDKSPVLVSSREAVIRFSLESLLDMHIQFKSISLNNSRINIVFDDKGISNIERFFKELPDDESSITADISTLKLRNMTLTLKNPTPILKPLEGTYTISGELNFKKTIELTESTLILPGKRGTLYPTLTIDVNKKGFKISGKTRLRNASLIWVYQWGKNLKLPYNVVNGWVKNLIITKDYVKGHADVVSTLRNSPKLLHANGGTTVHITNRKVLLDKIKGKIEKTSFFINNLRFTFEGKILHFKIEDIDAMVSDVKPLLDFLPLGLYGKVKGHLNFKDVYNGYFNLINCGYSKSTKMLSNVSTAVTIKDNTFNKSGVPVLFFGNPCTVSVATTDRSFKKIFLNVNADRMALDNDKHSLTGSDSNLSITNNVAGQINIKELYFKSYMFSDTRILYEYNNNKIKMTGYTFKYSGGTVNGSGSVNTAASPPRASMHLKFNNMKMQEILSSYDKFSNRVFGWADGKAEINFELSKKIFKTARGNVEFSISRGKLVDTGVQNGLGLWLSELKYKLKNLEFNTIYGDIDIRGTDYLIKNFIFSSDDIRLKIIGKFDQDLTAKPLNVDLEFTNHFVQDLPGAIIALGLKKYYRNGWYSVPFILKGDINNSKNLKRR